MSASEPWRDLALTLRLRAYSNGPGLVPSEMGTMLEAADEIERLRADLAATQTKLAEMTTRAEEAEALCERALDLLLRYEARTIAPLPGTAKTIEDLAAMKDRARDGAVAKEE